MIFHQLFEHESSTYSYLLADEETKEAIIIDPVIETVSRDLLLLKELGLTLLYTLETHIHADHITGAHYLKLKAGSKTMASIHAKIPCLDINLKDGDIIKFGKYQIIALETQGHTDSCMSFLLGDMVFTGDLLFIRGTGRTDFQQGDAKKMYHNIHHKIFKLPKNTKIYPGHDYKGFTYSTVEAEMQYNPRIGIDKTEADFIKIMTELKLAEPKKLKEAVPANLKCGNI